MPPLVAAAQPAGAGAPGTDVARAQSSSRPGLICIGDACVEMPEDGWPIFPGEAEHPTHAQPEPAPEPEPEPRPDPGLESEPERRHEHEHLPEPEPRPGPGLESEPERRHEHEHLPESESRSGLGLESEPERRHEHEHLPDPGLESEPELKLLPPRPQDVCPDGRTLASYQREDYATWYCEATIPEPVGETVVWPLEPDTEHPSYEQFRTRWLSHPMDVWVGMVFHNPDTSLSGIVTDIVWHDEFNVDRYYVHICVGHPHDFEYFNYAFPEPDGSGRVRMRVDNLIALGPCAAELE